MDVSISDGAVTASLSAVTGALVSYLVAKYQARVALRGNVDAGLIRRREQLYPAWWRLTCALPRWPRTHGRTYEDIEKLGLALRDWYFEEGGLYLSEQARRAYGVLRERMASLPARTGVLSDVDYELLFEAASRLRTELTRDLLSRERPHALTA